MTDFSGGLKAMNNVRKALNKHDYEKCLVAFQNREFMHGGYDTCRDAKVAGMAKLEVMTKMIDGTDDMSWVDRDIQESQKIEDEIAAIQAEALSDPEVYEALRNYVPEDEGEE